MCLWLGQSWIHPSLKMAAIICSDLMLWTAVAASLKDLEVPHWEVLHPLHEPVLSLPFPLDYSRMGVQWERLALVNGPVVYIILTPHLWGNLHLGSNEDRSWVPVDGSPTGRYSIAPLQVFKWKWKLNSLGTGSSPGFLSGKPWRQPCSGKNGGNRRLFLKLWPHGKHVGRECLGWLGRYLKWEGGPRPLLASNPPPPPLGASTNRIRTRSCP